MCECECKFKQHSQLCSLSATFPNVRQYLISCSCKQEHLLHRHQEPKRTRWRSQNIWLPWCTPLLVSRKMSVFAWERHRTVNVAISQCSGIKVEVNTNNCASCIQNKLVQILTKLNNSALIFLLNWKVILTLSQRSQLHGSLFVN